MKLRPHRELVEDSAFPFMVGRLVGAAEAAAIRMRNANPELAEAADRLEATASWFLKPQGVITLPTGEHEQDR